MNFYNIYILKVIGFVLFVLENWSIEYILL